MYWIHNLYGWIIRPFFLRNINNTHNLWFHQPSFYHTPALFASTNLRKKILHESPPWHGEGSLVALLPALDASGISLIFPAALVLGLLVAPRCCPLLFFGEICFNLDCFFRRRGPGVSKLNIIQRFPSISKSSATPKGSLDKNPQ